MENMHDDEVEIDLRELFFALKKSMLMNIVHGYLTSYLNWKELWESKSYPHFRGASMEE